MVLETVRLIRREYPDKLIIAGGVNARFMMERFFDAGVDLICVSEADTTIVEIARRLKSDAALTDVPGTAFRDGERTVTLPMDRIVTDLDELSLPAWDLLPNDKYWNIARPHGGDFPEGQEIRYA